MAFGRHDLSPSELQALLAAEREGDAFLAYRDPGGALVIRPLAGARHLTIGRAAQTDLPFADDTQMSRTHAELNLVGADWTLGDDGLSRNGSFVNEQRIKGRRRLADGDVMRFGNTRVLFRSPDAATAETSLASSTLPELTRVTPAQKRVLVALCRPLHEDAAVPELPTNQEIAEELFLSLEGVRTHMRALFAQFHVEDLPRNRKRAELARRAIQLGIVTKRDALHAR